MDPIHVSIESETDFHVSVRGDTTTSHKVFLAKMDFQRLAGGEVSREALVKMSFEFLLEREPNTSILPQFDLSDISMYYPEYEEEIRRRIRALRP